MSKFVTLALEPRFEDWYGEHANLPVFNAHGDVVGYTGGEVPETGNPCEFYVMDEEGFPVCHSASENAKLREKLKEETAENKWAREFLNGIAERIRQTNAHSLVNYVETIEAENAKLRELVRDMYGCVSHANEQDWFYFERHALGCGMSCTVNGEGCGLSVFADRMEELGVDL